MDKFDFFILCPVPREQRPFYEYLRRKQSGLLGWVKLNETAYTKRFFSTFLTVFLLALPIVNWFINFFYYPLQTIIVNFIVSLIIQGLIYSYFFLAWTYTGRRLVSAKVFYEESGWFDGRVWTKPPTILRHERLLYHYQLLPLISRIGKTLRLIMLNIVVLCAILPLITY
jgi:hypothetical protein